MAPGERLCTNFTWANCSLRPEFKTSTRTRCVAPMELLRKRNKTLFALHPQALGPFPDNALVQLRHTRCWCFWPGREWKDVQIGETAFINDTKRVLKHLISFSREPRDDIGTENHIGSA